MNVDRHRLARLARRLAEYLRPLGSSAGYWDRRYRAGGTSGAGSYGDNAAIKAAVVNEVVRKRGVDSVIEFGCGDGNQLTLLDLPRYVGLDVAPAAIELCSARFAHDLSKSFFRYDPNHFIDRAGVLQADLALSQEVIFHLVEDDVYEVYMSQLFDAAGRLVLICSTDYDLAQSKHVRHRTFTNWVVRHRHEWRLAERIANPRPFNPATNDGMMADFYLFERTSN